MHKPSLLCAVCAYLIFFGNTVNAATVTTYSNRVDFLTAIGDQVFDDYTDPGYLSGDLDDSATFDRHSDAHMSGVLGETQYTATTFGSHIIDSSSPRHEYCSGCNGSFLLEFGSTSVTSGSGVFGVGLGMIRNYLSQSDTLASWNAGGNRTYTVFAVYGDGTTENLSPQATFTVDEDGILQNGDEFWGFTSDEGIVSIHLGLPDGEINFESAFVLGDLTIAASPIPIPPAVWLFGSGLLGLTGFSRRKNNG